MVICNLHVIIVIIAVTTSQSYTSTQSGTGGCTMHMYDTQDKVNGACGNYYGSVPASVNGGFITAWKDLPDDGCGICIKVTSLKTSKSTNVLVVDKGGAMGLDMSEKAIAQIDPDWAKAGNTPCKWEVVSASDCQGGSSDTTTPAASQQGNSSSTPAAPQQANNPITPAASQQENATSQRTQEPPRQYLTPDQNAASSGGNDLPGEIDLRQILMKPMQADKGVSQIVVTALAQA